MIERQCIHCGHSVKIDPKNVGIKNIVSRTETNTVVNTVYDIKCPSCLNDYYKIEGNITQQ